MAAPVSLAAAKPATSLVGPSFPTGQPSTAEISRAASGPGPSSANAGPSASTAGSSKSAPSSVQKKRKASPSPAKPDRLASVGADHTDDDGASVGSRPARDSKRTRVHFSCVECHRRKQKCDRKEPCSQCVARRVPHLCRPFLNGVEDPAQTDVTTRLTSIEHLLTRLISSLPPAVAASAGVTAGSPGAQPDLSSLIQSSGDDVFHPAAAPPVDGQQPAVPVEGLQQNMTHKPPPSGQFPANISSSAGRSGYGWGLREGRLINLSLDENPDLQDVLATLKESGISKNHLEWLVAGVPGRRMADGLVDLYFRDIDWTRYKINKPSFMKRYTIFFDSIGRNPTNPKIDGDTLRWLPLMFIVLAIAALSAPHDIIAQADQAAWSRRFFGSGKSSLEYAKALQRDNLDVLFAGLLASRYMLLTRRPAEGSTPLTTAFQLGLYRDGTVLNISDKREVEVRRRAWAMLYHLDRTISLLVGRPASISDAHTDTRMPANLDDEDLDGDFDPAGKPMSKPTTYTYVILRHKLAEIMGRIAYHTFAIQLPDYQRVLELDKELLAWKDSLPAFFNMIAPETKFDKTHPYLFVQRHLLACEWYYTRITLNRPYLLRRKPQDSRYAYSKDAAIESATADLLSRRAFVMEKGNLIVNSGGYRVLNSYMVLGVTIKLDPDSPQADKLRHLLNIVSGRGPDSNGRVSEPLVKEELAIVEFLTAKTTGPKPSPAGGGPSETPVDLLLGLAKTRSGKRAAEEEKRQQRQQAAREIEEQRNQTKKQGGMSSPWGYQPPSMPGLDVQQPFDNSGQRRGPRPLQPPVRPRGEQVGMNGFQITSQPSQPPNMGGGGMTSGSDWSPRMNFGNLDLSLRPSSAQSGGSGNAASHRQSPDNAFGSSLQHQRSFSQQPQPSPTQLNQPFPNSGGNQFQMSPFNSMSHLPFASPNTSTSHLGSGYSPSQLQQMQNNDIFSGNLEQFIASMGQNSGMPDTSPQNSLPGMSQSQFGNASLENFDFANLGLDLPGGDILAGGAFNPFALPQTEDG